jgi:hypothetical protein
MHFSLNETIQLCALHIASVPDTFSGVTFATKYFRDSPVVKVTHMGKQDAEWFLE